MLELTRLESRLTIATPTIEQPIQMNNHYPLTIRVKRDDNIHPVISGNKWRKLKYHLVQAIDNNTQHIISFGGGFSNHLHALGYCCQQLNLKFTAVVRGDYSKNPSPMLKDIQSWGAEIEYVNKTTYATRHTDFTQTLTEKYPTAMIIPEGGSNSLALKGVAEIVEELQCDYDFIIAPVASGGTLAGLIKAVSNQSLSNRTQVLGIGVLKGQDYLEELVNDLLADTCHHTQWQINHHFHFGGYAKKNNELINFCHDFEQQHQIPIEPVYSGKLFFALDQLIKNNYFPKDSRILVLHTGGLQGAR